MPHVMTVLGPIPTEQMGLTLPHEHVLCDFAGAEKTGPHRWDREAVTSVMLPLLRDAHVAGARTFIDCSPAFIARDPELLRDLSRATSLHILTNTGYYKEPYLPAHALSETADQLAARWVKEAREGIEGTGIRPGFLKIAVNPGPLVSVQQKIVRAAVRAQKQTGLAIACHTGHAEAAHQALDLVLAEQGSPDRFIIVHSDGIEDRSAHLEIWDRGAWIEYDAVGWKPLEWHVDLITWFLEKRGPVRLLLSHDAGWYWAGEPNGGAQKPFTPLLRELVPQLRRRGVTEAVIHQLLVVNPARAFAVKAS